MDNFHKQASRMGFPKSSFFSSQKELASTGRQREVSVRLIALLPDADASGR
jgi:hypothetical protein